MIDVIGPGRAGTTISRRLSVCGRAARLLRRPDSDSARADAVILAVPDAAVATVAATVPAGPRLGTLAGSLALHDLGSRAGRFVFHPMQTITLEGGPEQLDGTWIGITATDESTARWAEDLADDLRLTPLRVPDEVRPLPHIACVFASNLLIGPLVAALRTCVAAGLDPDLAGRALLPLATRAVENALADGPAAAPTGPLARGDVATVMTHRAALRHVNPDLDDAYVALSRLASAQVSPTAAGRVAAALTPTGGNA
jgi:predicted short-subunit dehydrogenase-like oxidoreductase (DUF2520 family)